MKRIRGWRSGFLGICLLLVGYPIVAAATAGYSWRERDWNSDGRTTLGEWYFARNVVTLRVVVDGRACTEYLEDKGGHLLRLDCPASG